jgi:hypothetical protein
MPYIFAKRSPLLERVDTLGGVGISGTPIWGAAPLAVPEGLGVQVRFQATAAANPLLKRGKDVCGGTDCLRFHCKCAGVFAASTGFFRIHRTSSLVRRPGPPSA